MDLPAHRFLEERDIPHRRLEFPADTEKGAANVARALGYSEAQDGQDAHLRDRRRESGRW